ncbi:MAG: hypothetical protein ABSG31_12880 [Tepidisphaeraceae bacterium]|jgi:hypothetical protein
MDPSSQHETNQAAPAADANAVCLGLADQCVKSAKKAYDETLDYSVTSLQRVEHILDQMHQEHKATPITPAGMNARCLTLGGYVGEVLRRAHPVGTWKRDSVIGKDTFPLVFPQEQEMFPMSWVHKRILNGEGDNIVFKAQVLLSTLRGEGPFGNPLR